MTLAEFFTTDLGKWVFRLGAPTLVVAGVYLFLDDRRGRSRTTWRDQTPPKRSPGGYYRADYSDFGHRDHGGGGDPNG